MRFWKIELKSKSDKLGFEIQTALSLQKEKTTWSIIPKQGDISMFGKMHTMIRKWKKHI